MSANNQGSREPLPEELPRDGETSRDVETPPDTDAPDEPLRREPVRRSSDRTIGFLPRWLGIALVAVVAGGSLFLGGFTLGARVATTPGTPASVEQQFDPFWDVYQLITQRYAGGQKPSNDALVKAAIKGMLESLNDPWSYYQEPADFQQSNLNVGGHDQGIGVIVQLQGKTSASCATNKVGPDCELAVVQPIPGSPAEKAGVQAGDVIEKVDGRSLDGLTTDQITPLIKGPQGTTVKLALRHAGLTIQLSIVRSVFDRPQVDTKTLANGAAQYIDVAGINDVAAGQFHNAVKAALAAGRRTFIVDLRGDPGGYVNSAVTMASEFISSGVIVYQTDANGQTSAINATPGGQATDPSIRVVVLVDKNTASAAEILAAALQSDHRAELVGDGNRTYGKGVVQAWLPLPNNLGGVHLTVARWLTPAKVWINGKGLTPEIAVDTSNARAGTDPVLDAGLGVLGLPPQPSPSAGPSASPTAPSTRSPSPSPVPSASGS